MINTQIKKTFCRLSLGSIALHQLLHVALVGLSVLILQVKEHLGVIVMALQPLSKQKERRHVRGGHMIVGELNLELLLKLCKGKGCSSIK